MTKTLCIAVTFLLVGCDGPTNDEIIAETQKCRDAGMDTQTLINSWTYQVRKVQCVPKKD